MSIGELTLLTSRRAALFVASCAMALCAACTATSPSDDPSTALVPAGSVWKYLDDRSNQGTRWREPGFDDSSWPSGPAPLGHVPDGDRRLIKTTLKSGPFGDHIITYYFRRSFDVENPAAFGNLTILVRHDDGAIIYLNGTEVVRRNMPSGPVDYLTPVPIRVADEGLTWWEVPADGKLLTTGRNVVAVELHEYDYTTDAIFDLQLLKAR